MRNIRKDTKNKVLSGVLAGITKRYDWDANMLRLIYHCGKEGTDLKHFAEAKW